MKQHEDMGGKADLVRYRIETAQNTLNDAKTLLKSESYKGANNRAYYAIFHALNAIHALNGKAYKRHKDVLANFNKEYVKTGIFPKDLGRKISKAEMIRHASDYDDFYIATASEAEFQIKIAEEFISVVKNYCENELKNIKS